MDSVFEPDIFVTPRRGTALLPAKPRRDFVDVRWSDALPHAAARPRPRGAKRAGIEYETRVIDVLEAIYGPHFTRQPVIRYSLGRSKFAAVPDGILRLGEEVWILEVKLAHTPTVWEQLMDRYLPLVQVLEPGRRPRPVEICRSYDPAVRLPGSHKLIESLHSNPRGSELEVLRWKI